MSFWGLVLEPKKTYTQREVEQAFHISAATLDVDNCDPTEDAVSVVCRKQDSNFVLCVLSKKHKIFNVPLNLDFELGSEISFHVTGNSTVHLTGFLIEDLESFEESDDDDSMEEDEETDIEKALSKQTKKLLDGSAKRKQDDILGNKSKKAKVAVPAEGDDDDDDEDDSDFDGDSSGLDGLEEEAEEEEEEDDDDDDDDDDEDDDEDEDEDQDAAEILKKLEEAKKESSKKDKKEKPKNQQAVKASPKETLKVDQIAKQIKKEQKSPTSNKAVNGAEAQSNGTSKRTVKGGVVLEDLVVGTGPVAKEGSMVGVYYVGRLKQNNKQFDAARSGPGFKFRLGRGEVIKGWDVGVAGMKVGGKRRLTIPPKMGYGPEGSGSTIPPNSTLVFEVELKNVK